MDPRMNEWGSVQSLRPPGHGWGRKSACTQLHTITHMHRHTHRTGRLASCIHSHTDTHTCIDTHTHEQADSQAVYTLTQIHIPCPRVSVRFSRETEAVGRDLSQGISLWDQGG